MATNVVPFTRPLPNDGRAFERAYHAAMIAHAERALIEARWHADHVLAPAGRGDAWMDQRGRAYDKMEKAILALARTPARNRVQLRMKRRAVGPVWLNAVGERSELLREWIARDEAALGTSRAAGRVVSQ